MRVLFAGDIPSASRRLDSAGVPLDDTIRSARAQMGDAAMDVAVAARLHAWIGLALPAKLGVIDDLEQTTARLNAPVMDRLDGPRTRTVLEAAFVPVGLPERMEVAAQVFAVLAPMPRREILWRLATPEGLQLARAIVLVSEVSLDRQRRGIDPDPQVTFER